MKKWGKKGLAALLSAMLLLGVCTGCYSESKTWSAKRGDDTLATGVYIYELFAAFNEAENSRTDKTVPLMDTEFDGMKASDWILEEAKSLTRRLFYVEQLMEERDLTLSPEQESTVKSMASNYWSSLGSTFDSYGISQESFSRAYARYAVMYAAVFMDIYGKGGEKEVSDEEIHEYYDKKYVTFQYFCASLTTKNEDGEAVEMDGDAKKEVTDTFDGYALSIREGNSTMEKAAETYKEKSEASYDLLTQDTIDPTSESLLYPEDFLGKLAEMKEGEVLTFELPEQHLYVILQKNPIFDECQQRLESDGTRSAILSEMRGDEFDAMLKEGADSLTDIEWNSEVVGTYDPAMFVEKFSSTATPTPTPED